MTTEATKTEVGSYFISNYPPYSRWKPEFLPEVEKAMAAPPGPVPLGLYLHIPFCRKRCKFCYFKVFTGKKADEIETYVEALCKEIELVSQQPVMGERPFRFVYFGGGTPSFLSPKQLTSLVDRLRANISWDKAEEVTFECEPGTLSETKIKTLKELGVTRLSLGIENFNDKLLEENGRAHLSKEVFRAWEWIAAANFPNVNIDLISGMVGETWDNWKMNVAKTLELSPESVTIYQMELPFNTVYSEGMLKESQESPVADWPTKREWVKYAFEAFAEAGYTQSSAYTMIKDPNKVSFSYRDNLWKGSDLLATGIASFGHISGVHYQNLPEWKQYIGAIEEGRLPLGRAYTPTPKQALIRELILLLKRGYLEIDYFVNKFGVDVWEEYREAWQEYETAGYVSRDGNRIELSIEGLLRADALLPVFFEADNQGVRYT
ncbi:coproporphyrinogen-III oxidase family protein [Aureliella helgolandensis]|uniref:Oxygen-independent coproporphyrinogen-III oxidase 1 n=1 Tax=Aureliella helgolandensis TaxID=2527968 RepID=A0A518G8P7_9BACT|nr:coproporphyrinogen-III oxidase family protein [Aureliella helgolandensis]QDV24963.1 Oxygen-independent coproporphyrinogen-III oxidase 1 [Aureliella helgolandensis]